MINVEYTVQQQETANATLDFLSNRPFLAMLFTLMKISCIILCIGFAITIYTKVVRPQDFAAVILALIWLFYYKSINRWIIKSSLKARKFANTIYNFKIDQKSIFCRVQGNEPTNVEWKNIKHVLQNQDGYIVPLTGITNSGKFFWLPFRGFTTATAQQEFIDLVKQFKLPIKTLS